MNEISTIMGLWAEGLLSEQEVIAWADKQILDIDSPDYNLIELSLKGPEACSKKLPWEQFPPCRKFTYVENFALRIVNLDLKSKPEVDKFIHWITKSCMGEDYDLPEVSLGLQVDHYYWDCDSKRKTIRYLREEIPKYLPKCSDFVAHIESECSIKLSATHLHLQTKQNSLYQLLRNLILPLKR